MKTGGTIFGEISFFYDTKRTATVISQDNSKVFLLKKENLQILKDICPTIVRRLHMQIYCYKDEVI